MKKNNKKSADWVVGTDDVGQAVLQWNVGRDVIDAEEADPLARTFNLLKRLDVAGLSLEEEPSDVEKFDPYNTCAYLIRGARRGQKV